MPAVLEKFAAHLNLDLSAPPYAQMTHLREPAVLADIVATGDVVRRLKKIVALMKTGRQPA